MSGGRLRIGAARADEFDALGQLLVDVYTRLEGFPGPDEQPRYYALLANIGQFTRKPQVQLLAAHDTEDRLLGGVVYFGDMAHYGSGGIAGTLTEASGIRLLGVAPAARGMGVGRALTEACILRARERGHARVVLHTTRAMQVAWGMYERLGFARAPALDFMQGDLAVFGFSLELGIGPSAGPIP
ncbi:GNAT family N-acetyltransferase [Frateuria hangzhouensis]|uniref:GNAT family N-acetyltransferase n=1 Tax=Frateuria hangzhouensis TaxID=2995589 RepID=UPI002260ECFE|nr:N-acetyltransferase [Frateuria sp. STR12]MCX7514638.1 N-acetyltransferase [Frateuria sp. STR12]